MVIMWKIKYCSWFSTWPIACWLSLAVNSGLGAAVYSASTDHWKYFPVIPVAADVGITVYSHPVGQEIKKKKLNISNI